METQKNKDLLIKELQNEMKILNEILTNQATIIGLKDTIIYRFQERIDELEADKDGLVAQLKSPFFNFDRTN